MSIVKHATATLALQNQHYNNLHPDHSDTGWGDKLAEWYMFLGISIGKRIEVTQPKVAPSVNDVVNIINGVHTNQNHEDMTQMKMDREDTREDRASLSNRKSRRAWEKAAETRRGCKFVRRMKATNWF